MSFPPFQLFETVFSFDRDESNKYSGRDDPDSGRPFPEPPPAGIPLAVAPSAVVPGRHALFFLSARFQ